jgi:uncharacterized repeat protein (TIGR03943 family)
VDARFVRGAVLAAWALFFVTLWLTGASARYLGARTEWVVPFGAIVLTAALAGYAVLAVRSQTTAPALTMREAVGLVSLLIPLAAVLAAPNAALGSFAADRKDGGVFLSARPQPPSSPEDVSFLDIRVAEGDRHFALESGIDEGLRVRLIGIATGEKDDPPGTFELARFYVACCIADAQPVDVPIDAANSFPPDTWLEVTGVLDKRDGRYVVVADEIHETKRPRRPYLTFRF